MPPTILTQRPKPQKKKLAFGWAGSPKVTKDFSCFGSVLTKFSYCLVLSSFCLLGLFFFFGGGVGEQRKESSGIEPRTQHLLGSILILCSPQAHSLLLPVPYLMKYKLPGISKHNFISEVLRHGGGAGHALVSLG